MGDTIINYPSPEQHQPALDFPDRRTGLTAFGIVLIVLGCLCSCLVLLTPLALVAQNAGPRGAQPAVRQRPVDLIVGCAMYAALATLFIWTGIGSAKKQRWSRAIILIFCWGWLSAGILGLMVWLLMVPDFAKATAAASGQTLPAGTMNLIAAVSTIMLVVIYILLPLMFLLFYQRTDVRRTLEYFDPQPSWTDRCPLPVLGLSLALYAAAAMSLVVILAYPMFPLFGVLMTGWRGAAMMLVSASILAVLGRLTFKQSPAGWWGTLLYTLLLLVSFVVTYSRIELGEIYRQMGQPEQMIDAMRSYRFFNSGTIIAVIIVSTAAFIAYLFYVRKYFARAATH